MTSHHPEAPVVDTGPRTGPPDSLVLDIGGDIGALVLYAEEDLVGAEIDLTPVGEPQHHGVHTAIRRRRIVGHDVICGVYPQLAAGRYTVWGRGGRPVAVVRIDGGKVTEARLGQP